MAPGIWAASSCVSCREVLLPGRVSSSPAAAQELHAGPAASTAPLSALGLVHLPVVAQAPGQEPTGQWIALNEGRRLYDLTNTRANTVGDHGRQHCS